MTLAKAVEILELNIREVGKKMPPDVLAALKLNVEASKFVMHSRDPDGTPPYTLLPGETD